MEEVVLHQQHELMKTAEVSTIIQPNRCLTICEITKETSLSLGSIQDILTGDLNMGDALQSLLHLSSQITKEKGKISSSLF